MNCGLQQIHWTERGRAASVSNPDVTDRPRRSVLSLGAVMPTRINRLFALLLLLGAVGAFGLSLRRSYEVQDQTPRGAPVGPVRTVYVGKRERSFFIAIGLASLIGSAYFITRTRDGDLQR